LIDSNGRVFGWFGLGTRGLGARKKEKRASLRTPYAVIYKLKYITDYGFVKSNFA